MSDVYLLDTSVWIFALKKNYDPNIKSRVEKLIEGDKIVTMPLIKLELLAGTRTEKEFARLKLRLDALPEIAPDEKIWEDAQKIAFKLRKKGIRIPLIDLVIIAYARSFPAVLIHEDRHFLMAAKFLDFKQKIWRNSVS